MAAQRCRPVRFVKREGVTVSTFEEVLRVLSATLQLDGKAEAFTVNTQLLGSIPELDSMAVVTIITALEEAFGITVDDDEISADAFATVDSLCRFVDCKLTG